MKYAQGLQRLLVLVLVAGLGACATLDAGRAPELDKSARWVLLPAVNNTETVQAAARLEAITASLLRSQGVKELLLYPATAADDLLGPADRRAQEAALAWARSQNARYAVIGSVQEWRYKTGLDGEPAAGVALTIIDVGSGQVLWTGTGARTGWSREAVAAVAQKLIASLVHDALGNAK